MSERPSEQRRETGSESVPESSLTPLLLTIGDTTWRMFVPTIGFTLLGVWCDKQWQTKPWLMFAGIIIGFGGALLLVRRQYNQAKGKNR